jgi:hypothetical protein
VHHEGVNSLRGIRSDRSGLIRGRGAQLAFVPFLMGMVEVVSAQGRPSCPSTAAAAHAGSKVDLNRQPAVQIQQFFKS